MKAQWKGERRTWLVVMLFGVPHTVASIDWCGEGWRTRIHLVDSSTLLAIRKDTADEARALAERVVRRQVARLAGQVAEECEDLRRD